jgi:hypothetical protein
MHVLHVQIIVVILLFLAIGVCVLSFWSIISCIFFNSARFKSHIDVKLHGYLYLLESNVANT